jgi:hypothetical protein
MVYLWRAVDAEGEVLDVLVQSKRNKHAALKLMRKLLKKYAFVPERLITDDLRSYSAAARDLGIERRHVRGRWSSGSRVRVQPRSFFPHTPPSTTPLTSNAISRQPKRTACSAPRRWTHGGPQSQRPDNSRGGDTSRSHGNVTTPFCGYVTDGFGRRLIFLPNVVFAAAAIRLLVRYFPDVPHSADPRANTADKLGFLLLGAAKRYTQYRCANIRASRQLRPSPRPAHCATSLEGIQL